MKPQKTARHRLHSVWLALPFWFFWAMGLVGETGLANETIQPSPNIIVILVDDLRWDEISCAGHPFVRTPNIDRIAHEGMRFRNAFCTTPLCSPVRACLLTGLYTHNHGILDNTNRSQQSHRMWTFPQSLQTAGYETAYIGKWHMGNDDTPRPGFDTWACLEGQGTSFDPVMNVDGTHMEHTGHTTDVLNRRALDFVKRTRDKPFCLYLAHKALHPEVVQYDDGTVSNAASEFLAAVRHRELYADAAVPRRFNVSDGLEGKPAIARVLAARRESGLSLETSEKTVRDRLRMLAGVDEGVGQLFGALKEMEQLDNTVVVFTSDHGYWNSEHSLSVERRLAYEEALRIPLLVRYPKHVPAGSLADQFALSIDLAPTLLDMAGVETEQHVDGRSLAPLLAGEEPADWRTSFLIEYNSDIVFPHLKNMGYKAIRTERWKYIRYNELHGEDELYDLLADPYEMNNIIDEPASEAVERELSHTIDGFLSEER